LSLFYNYYLRLNFTNSQKLFTKSILQSIAVLPEGLWHPRWRRCGFILIVLLAVSLLTSLTLQRQYSTREHSRSLWANGLFRDCGSPLASSPAL